MTRNNTQSIILIFLAVLLAGLAFAALVVPKETRAQSVKWNETFSKTLYYAWTDGLDSRGAIGGWGPGLQNPNVTVKYYVRVIDVTNGARLNDGDRVEVGTQIRFRFMPHEDKHIYWFGTGFSDDSPYGHWRSRDVAYRPDDQYCLSQDYLGTFPSYWDNAGQWDAYDVYVPLNIKEPEHGFNFGFSSNRTTAGLRKINDDTWEVTSAGDISAKFIWRETDGKFFYRYKANWNDPEMKMTSGLCVANNYAMREDGKTEVEDFLVTVPEQELFFNLRAVNDSGSNNRNPNPPVIWGPDNFVLGELYTYKFRATDPDGDRIRYFIDFPTLGTTEDDFDSRRPTQANGTFVDSGTVQEIGKRWDPEHLSSDGKIRFEVFAKDDVPDPNKGVSRRTQYVINPVPPLDVTCKGAPSEIQTGQSVRWSATISDGTPPYTYRWLDGSFSSTEVAPERTYGNVGMQSMYLEIEDENGNKGSVNCSEVRVVAAEPDGWIWADEYNLTKDESTLVSWDSTDADYCEVRENGAEPARWPDETSALTGKDTGPLTDTTTYELYCSNGASSPTKMDEVTITVRPQCSDGKDNADPEDLLVDMADPGCDSPDDNDETNAATPTMTAEISGPPSVSYGQPAEITWYNINNADTCTVTSVETGDSWSSISDPTSRTSADLTGDATFNLQCLPVDGATPSVINESVTVTVTGGPPVMTAEISGPASVSYGQPAEITWYNINNADTCTVTSVETGDSWSSISDPTSRTSADLTGDATFNLQCLPVDGATPSVINESVTVTVTGAPACDPISLTASSDFIVLGNTVTLTWGVANTCNFADCTITGSGIPGGSMALTSASGDVDVTPTGYSAYTLNCGASSLVPVSIPVEVEQSGQES